MHFLLYVSSATNLMSDAELSLLLDRARRRNEEDQVTGMLLYKEGSIMQLLEGEKETVSRTFARISSDPRHTGLIVLREGAIDERSFDGWSMGFKSVNAADLESIPGFERLGGETFTASQIAGKPHVAVRMLKIFHQETR